MTDAATGVDDDANVAEDADAPNAATAPDSSNAATAPDTHAGDATTTNDGAPRARDTVEGAWLAAEVGSLVSASVAFALHLDGSTSVAIPGGSTSALAVTFALLALAALAAAGKARHRGQGLRAVGQGVTGFGLATLALGGSVVLAAVGGLAITAGTIGVVVAVAGLNLVVFSFLM